MSYEVEKMLQELTPRGASAEVRARILAEMADTVTAMPSELLPASEQSPMPETPWPRPKERWTTLKRTVLIGAVCVAVLIPAYLFGNSVWIWTTGDRLEKKLAAIRDAGDPVTLADLARPDLLAEKNAAERLQRARKDTEAMLKVLSPITFSDDYQGGKLTEANRQKLKPLFEANAGVLMLVEEAANCPVYVPQLDYTAKPDAVQAAALTDGNDFRGVITLLEARSRLQLAAGTRREALQTCLLLFRLSRLYDGSLFMVNELTACAGRSVAAEACNRVLRAGPVEDKDRDALEAELKLHDSHNGIIQALKKERALGASSFEAMKHFVNRAFLDNDECFYLDLVQEQIDLAAKPYGEFAQVVNNFKAAPVKTAPLTALWFPAAQKTREADERVRGVIRCLRVFNALQRARIAPQNGEPRFTDLKLPAEVTKDPFTDEPLKVKVVDGQWLIYTVGPDLADDGGDLANHKDFGVGPTERGKK